MDPTWYEWVVAIGSASFGIIVGIVALVPPKKPHITLVPEPEEDEQERHLRAVK